MIDLRSTALLFVLGAAEFSAAPATLAPNGPVSPISVACGETRRQLPEPDQFLWLSANSDGVLTLVEHGQDIVVRARDVVEISTPPRLGMFSLLLQAEEKVQVSRAFPGAAPGYVEIILDCKPGAETTSKREWQKQVQALERDIANPLPTEAYERLLPQLEAIRSSATAGYSKLLADHLRAQSLLMTGRSADAKTAFETVREAWLAVGDHERALAALVAQTEDLLRVGAYREVLTLARSLKGSPDRSQYYGARLENSRCLALEYLSELEESSHCFEWTLRAMVDLGETLQQIGTQLDYARVERDQGKLAHATKLATDALAAISAPQWDGVSLSDIPILRGRVERLLTELSLRQGDIAESLRHAQRALAHFEQAHHIRWQANTLLRIAAIYNQIGAYADATDAVNVALQRLSPRDAPERIAEAERTKAEIEFAAGSTQEAIGQARKAKSMFDALQMPADAASAELTIAEAELASGQTDEARSILGSMKVIPPALASRAQLLGAELATRDGPGESTPSSDVLKRQQARPLPEWLRAQIVLAKRRHAQGQRASGLAVLESAAKHVSDLAWRARNPILRTAIERQRRQLLAAALPMIVSAESMTERVENAWHWILLTEAAPARSKTGPQSYKTDEFDRALAESLLPSPASGRAEGRLQQHLLELVASTSSGSTRGVQQRVAETPLRQFQATLPQDTALVALLAGGSMQAVLYVSAERATVHMTSGDAEALRRQALNLTSSIIADAPVATIDQEATELSQALLGPLDGRPVPRHVLVIASEPFNGLPWALLRWPHAPDSLIETTSVSLVSPGESPMRDTSHSIPFHIFGGGAEAAELADLAAVTGELSAIAQMRRQVGWTTDKVDAPKRGSVLSALADENSWIHIAAHGSSMADYLGRSGLWLGTQSQGDSGLLSWMDVVEQGIRADVVVLNACALAGSPTTSLSASTGFADALLRAGTNQVIAALWPINDTAASLWATTFYSHLSARPSREEIADALRSSMLRLREARAFRHPKYWASLVHLARLELPAMADSAARKQAAR